MPRSRAVAVRRTRVIHMRSHRRFHKAKMTIPLAIVAGALPGILDTVKNGSSNGWGTNGSDSGMTTFLGDFFGVQTPAAAEAYTGGKTWSTWRLKYGLYPLLIGFAGHYAAQKFGLNRMLARARVPLVRI
jgi:hypothetical protein